MCGIAGQIADSGDGVGAVTRMTDAILHRGPDDAGIWSSPDKRCVLGFRRLSIIDVSPLGHQPMASRSGRYMIVFNGEIYNHLELQEELRGLGHGFRGRSDTEVLLAMFEQYGFAPALKRIRGMFAIAVWDQEERALFLARDRFGEKPLYYGVGKRSTVLFASEVKALQAHPDFEATVDRGALMRYLRRGCVPQSLCIYKGVKKLLPGTFLRIAASEDVNNTPTPYYSIVAVAEDAVRSPLQVDLRGAGDLLDAELRRAVREQMVSDVPLGAFLSGGIDSSTIVALMQAQSTRPVQTFSIGFDQDSHNEAPFAHAIAKHLGTAHEEVYVTGRQALDVIPELPSIYDEPFADSSQVPTVLVSRLARRSVTVALTGDGSDEILAGYPRYDMLRRLRRPFGMPGRRAVASALRVLLARATRGGTSASFDRRYADWAMRRADVASAADLDAFYDLYMSLWYHPDWMMPGEIEAPGPTPLPPNLLANGNETERAMLADMLHNLPDDLLVKVDRASMSTSLETRMPFLDPGVVELAWRLPFATKVQGTIGKVVLREVLERYVPRPLFDRPKMGFMVPLVAWLRGPLREWAESLLDEKRLREEGFLDPAVIRRRWNGFQAGVRDWHGTLWMILMWQAWLEAHPVSN